MINRSGRGTFYLGTVLLVGIAVVGLALALWALPRYWVYSQEMSGRA